jgi:hypothetical protein
MNIKTRSATTVGALIKQLEKLPKTAKLDGAVKPVLCNTGETAKKFGLTPVVSLETN